MPELDLFSVQRGTVTAPAGCGKTQLIADTLKLHTDAKPVLVLTHTNAGKGAIEARLARAMVPKSVNQRRKLSTFQRPIFSTFEGR